MSSSEIKKKLHNYIDLIQDEEELLILNEAGEAYVANRPDIIELLTKEQLQRLDESIQQADQDNFISHDTVLQKSREWYKRGIK